MGVGPNIGTWSGHRVFWNSTKRFGTTYDREFQASKSRYISWFHTSKAFANVYNGRTYAQVASKISNQSWVSSANRDNVKGTRIVTVPQGNANAALVTSSKVSIEPKPSRSVGRAPLTGLNHKVCSQYLDTVSQLSHVPVNNRFQVLQNLDENICETQGNAPTALEEVVTASAIPIVQKIRGKKLRKASNIKMFLWFMKKATHLPNLLIMAHNLVRQSGVPNFFKCRIPVETANVWRTYLKDYWDQQLPDLLQFRFPLDRDSIITSSYVNYTSANQFHMDVQAYIDEELAHGAMYSPYNDPPFPVHISPLMTREKQNSAVRRTIVDLSWPKGASVNDFVHKCKYLDTYFTLQYPSIDDITNKLKELGPGALLYKVDISRAFRQLRVDPGDIDLLGIVHNHLYLDGSVPFGFRLGSGFLERCSDAIRYIMQCHGHNALLNYIDDLIYIGLLSKIHDSYAFLLSLLQDLGLQVSTKKLVPPSTEVVCLGILINTIHKTISIPPEKLQEIKNMCKT